MDPSRPQNAGKRATVAFFFDNPFDYFEDEIWKGVSESAESLDVDLLCFVGGNIGPEARTRARLVYDLATPDCVDGLIVVSGSIALCATAREVVSAFLARYAPLPIVTLCSKEPGLPAILSQNASGIDQVIDHLVLEHGRRRIAFIGGPVGHQEAEARLASYHAALSRHGLPDEPALVCHGTFRRDSGARAIQVLLDERHASFDAVVAANDFMAVGAVRALSERGRAVPMDVSVVGFDDVREALECAPPLTTVRQPFRQIGQEGVRRLLAIIRGESVPETTSLPTEMVIRGSCGCSLSDRRATAVTVAPEGLLQATELANRLDGLFPELRASGAGWAEELAQALIAERDGQPAPRFLPALERLLGQNLGRELSLSQWYQIVNAAFDAVQAQAGEDSPALGKARCAALMAIGSRVELAHAMWRTRFEQEFILLERAFLQAGLDEGALERVLRQYLPSLGIRSFFLSRFIDDSMAQASLLMHYDPAGCVLLDSSPGPFPVGELVPGRFTDTHRHAYAVLPIFADEVAIGIALCELGPNSGAVFQLLINQIGRSLRGISLLREVSRHASELETRVEERTRQLKEKEQQLLETAHQAGMAEVAVGMMHNVGNLLNSIGISAEELLSGTARPSGLARANALLMAHQADLPGFFARDPSARLLPEYYTKTTEAVEGARQNLHDEARTLLDRVELVKESIRMLQEYARVGKESAPREEVQVAQVIEAALKLQSSSLSRNRIELRQEIAAVPPIVAERAKLVHTFVNLIKNAIEAMRTTPLGERRLTIELRSGAAGQLMIRIADTGAGIAPENRHRIFSYGFTTKESGNGFGLHTCANYVKQMGGSIAVESQGPGLGASFIIVLKPMPAGGARASE